MNLGDENTDVFSRLDLMSTKEESLFIGFIAVQNTKIDYFLMASVAFGNILQMQKEYHYWKPTKCQFEKLIMSKCEKMINKTSDRM